MEKRLERIKAEIKNIIEIKNEKIEVILDSYEIDL